MRRFVVLLSVVIGVVVLWSGGWLFAAAFVRGQIDAQSTASPSVACSDLSIAGFPFRFDIACKGARLVDGDVTVEVDEVRVSALVYMPTFVEIFARGPARYADAFSGASYQLDWSKLQASVRLDWTSLARASLVADDLVLNDTVLDVLEVARVGHAEFHAVGADGAVGADNRNIALFARLDKAVVPQNEAPIDANASVLVTEWPADVRTWGAADILPFWSAGDGALEIETAQVTTGDLWAEISGTLAPDQTGRLDGALTLRSRGVSPMMQQYMAAPLAGALLGPEDAGGEARQTLGITHSVLRAGIVPLLELPPLF